MQPCIFSHDFPMIYLAFPKELHLDDRWGHATWRFPGTKEICGEGSVRPGEETYTLW